LLSQNCPKSLNKLFLAQLAQCQFAINLLLTCSIRQVNCELGRSPLSKVVLESLNFIFLANENQTNHDGDDNDRNPGEEAIEKIC
jgi:hypothetical protein